VVRPTLKRDPSEGVEKVDNHIEVLPVSHNDDRAGGRHEIQAAL
jgi:hypothetical protein